MINTINTGFISSTWRVTSSGMFAGSCIGVILLVISLAFLRKVHRKYDAHVSRLQRSHHIALPTRGSSEHSSENIEQGASKSKVAGFIPFKDKNSNTLRPTLLQQTTRALLHAVEFGVAYFIMLLAMYYNGYFIICIIIGAFLGYFIFEWDSLHGYVEACYSNMYEIRSLIRKQGFR